MSAPPRSVKPVNIPIDGRDLRQRRCRVVNSPVFQKDQVRTSTRRAAHSNDSTLPCFTPPPSCSTCGDDTPDTQCSIVRAAVVISCESSLQQLHVLYQRQRRRTSGDNEQKKQRESSTSKVALLEQRSRAFFSSPTNCFHCHLPIIQASGAHACPATGVHARPPLFPLTHSPFTQTQIDTRVHIPLLCTVRPLPVPFCPITKFLLKNRGLGCLSLPALPPTDPQFPAACVRACRRKRRLLSYAPET